MRQEIELSYDTEPIDGSSHEDFSVKIQDYICVRFGTCEVVDVLNNLGKNGELKKGCDHSYSIVMKFETNSLANQIKQKFHGMTLFKVCFFTSWWPRKHLASATDDSVTTPSRGRGRGRIGWARGGRFASWRGSKFGLSTSHYRGSRGARRPFRAGFTSPRGHGMFRRSDFGNQEGGFGEHSSQVSEQEASSSSSSLSLRSRSSASRREVSTVKSSSKSSPTRVRRVSMASSTSESNSENGSSEKGHSSESSSVDSYPRITSPIRVDTESPKEEKSEGRVLRSHSSQQASNRKKQTQTKAKSTTPTNVQPSSSRYNTRSKKRVLEEKQMPSPKRRQTGRPKVSMNETDSSSYRKRSTPGPRKKEPVRNVVAIKRVVTIMDSDSSSPKCLQSGKVSGGTGESSQSEEEVWVERKEEIWVERKVGLMNVKQEAMETVETPTKELSTSDISSPKASSSDESEEVKAIPTETSDSQDQSNFESGASSSTATIGEGQVTLQTTAVKENDGHSTDYSCDRDLGSAMMSPLEERDETPPAELLEATMMQGDYSEWYRNDPEAWRRYMEYYNAMMMAGGSEGDLKASTGEAEVASQPATASAAATDESVGNATEDEVQTPGNRMAPSTSFQRPQSLPPDDAGSCHCSSDSRGRSLPPDWAHIITTDNSGLAALEQSPEKVGPSFLGEFIPVGDPLPVLQSAEASAPSISLRRDRSTNTDVGVQTLADMSHESIEIRRQIIPVRRKISRKHKHLQKQALRKFIQSAKPLVLNTDLLIRHSPSNEDALVTALAATLENISDDLVGELWSQIDEHDAITASLTNC